MQTLLQKVYAGQSQRILQLLTARRKGPETVHSPATSPDYFLPTTYHLRAFATNSAGTAYGNEISFTTLSVSVPTVTTAAITSLP